MALFGEDGVDDIKKERMLVSLIKLENYSPTPTSTVYTVESLDFVGTQFLWNCGYLTSIN